MATFGDLLISNQLSPYDLMAIAVVTATVGMFSHWGKLALRSKATTNPFIYFFVDNVKASILAFISMLVSLALAFAPLDYTTITIYQVLTQAFALGYASDSIFNNTTSSDPSQ